MKAASMAHPEIRPILFIRADASTDIGTGHVMRCIALGQAWRAQHGEVVFTSYCKFRTLQARILEEGFDFLPIEEYCPNTGDLETTLSVLRNRSGATNRSDLPYNSYPLHWLVTDGYHFNTAYHKAIRAAGYRVLDIDDMNHLNHYYVDILLNQNSHADSLEYNCDRGTIQLMGSKYVLLRREFLQYRNWKRDNPVKAKNILITLGGSDPNNVSAKVIKALNQIGDHGLQVKVLVDPGNPNIRGLKEILAVSPFSHHLLYSARDMPPLMAWADMAVSAAGSTCWELAFMRVPSLVVILSQNQEAIAQGLDKASAAFNCGWFYDLSVKQLAEHIDNMITDWNTRATFIGNSRQLVDGLGAERLIKCMRGY